MSLQPELRQKLESLVSQNDVVLFMKGNRNFPQCGFSSTVVQILDTVISEYHTVNILADPAVRQGMKDFSDWPTFPQLYVKGEFVGGCDIIREMFESGELHTTLGISADTLTPPAITLTDKAIQALRTALADESDEMFVHLAIDPKFQHGLDVGPRTPQDVVVESNGFTILVEPTSAKRAEGLIIDFVDGPDGSGFKMNNPNRPPEVLDIDPRALKAKIDAGEIKELFDVRSEGERNIASIENSKLLDKEMMTYIERIDINTPIAFFCHHGGRSIAAAEHFRDRGFRQVYNLIGGIDAWSQQVDPTVPTY